VVCRWAGGSIQSHGGSNRAEKTTNDPLKVGRQFWAEAQNCRVWAPKSQRRIVRFSRRKVRALSLGVTHKSHKKGGEEICAFLVTSTPIGWMHVLFCAFCACTRCTKCTKVTEVTECARCTKVTDRARVGTDFWYRRGKNPCGTTPVPPTQPVHYHPYDTRDSNVRID